MRTRGKNQSSSLHFPHGELWRDEPSRIVLPSGIREGAEPSQSMASSSFSSISWHWPIKKEGLVDQPSTLGNEASCAQSLPQGSISTSRSFLQPRGSQRMLLLVISSPSAGGIVWDRVLVGLVHGGRKGGMLLRV